MEAKKVLIITYYWPPSGGSGVQRWLKFVKYFPENGIEPHIYTPENPDFNVTDDSLLKDIPKEAVIVKRKIIEPYGIHRFLVGKKQAKGSNFGNTNSSKTSKVQKLSLWVRSNVFLPDPRVLWVKPSIRFLKKYIKENNIDTIITTGPPHSMHLIGMGLKAHFDDEIQWIADFRDPWTKIFNKDLLLIGKRARKKLIKLESRVIKSCDKLITVSEYLKTEFEEMGGEGKSYSVTNGYDKIDFENQEIFQEEKFVISYLGLLPKVSNPEIFWKVLNEISQENENFKKDLELRFIGTLDSSIIGELKKNNLIQNSNFIGVVKHSELKKFFRSTQVLLLLIPNVENSKGILTGKIFEYLAAKRPILAFGDPEGEVNDMLEEANAGKLFSYLEKDKVKEEILNLYQKYKENKLFLETSNIEKYSRTNLTEKLVKIINKNNV